MNEATPLQIEIESAIDRNNILSVALYRKLRESLSNWDILPDLISGVVWQTKEEIANTWILTHAGDEWAEFEKFPTLFPESKKMTSLQMRWIQIYVAESVEALLTASFGWIIWMQRKLFLLVRTISELPMADQHRAFALDHDIPYAVWYSFFRILSNSPSLREFYRKNTVFLEYNDSVLTLSHQMRKWWEVPEIEAPVWAKIEVQDWDFLYAENGGIRVDLREGVDQSLHMDHSVLEHAATLLPNKSWEKAAREILYEQHPILLWKKRFSGGKKSKPKDEPRWELAWQK